MVRWMAMGLLLIGLAGTGCGDGEADLAAVGAECGSDAHCARGSTCMRGGDYPDGMCTIRCSHSGQCPDYAVCADKDGGVCLVTCSVDNECPVGWECKNRDLEGAGRALVCLGD